MYTIDIVLAPFAAHIAKPKVRSCCCARPLPPTSARASSTEATFAHLSQADSAARAMKKPEL